MHWLIDFLLSVWPLAERRDDDSVVGESGLDRRAKRFRLGCLLALISVALGVAAYFEWGR